MDVHVRRWRQLQSVKVSKAHLREDVCNDGLFLTASDSTRSEYISRIAGDSSLMIARYGLVFANAEASQRGSLVARDKYFNASGINKKFGKVATEKLVVLPKQKPVCIKCPNHE